MEVTIGKNTIGDGNKMKVDLQTYNRSTSNKTRTFTNTQSVGTLVPFMREYCQTGDTWEIELHADVKTHPTVGPLFGSFKFQNDLFLCPIRLYHSWLHNNKLDIGNDMASVKLPLLSCNILDSDVPNNGSWSTNNPYPQIHPSSILWYLGKKGWGRKTTAGTVTTRSNALKLLSYYDIYKNYYANVQQTDAYIVGASLGFTTGTATGATPNSFTNLKNMNLNVTANTSVVIVAFTHNIGRALTNTEINSIQLFVQRYPDMTGEFGTTIANLGTVAGNTNTQLTLKLNKLESYATSNAIILKVEQFPTLRTLESFPLKNLDDIREKILYNNSTTAYIVDGYAPTPFGLILSHDVNNKLNTTYPQYGLAIKTYQSDIFNNWLNTTTVNNITSKTNISTASGSFSIDTLVTSKKIWEMLNKISIAGGTYEDWLNTMFTNSYHKNTEIPVYIGGMSQEIVFQEILSNSATANEPLGTLAGRGILSKHGKKGGKIKIRVDEPSYLIGISSITPRIMYSQGNDYDDLILTMDDFHKPALDQIGFQDLLTDKMLWSQRDLSNPNSTLSAGKQPAWIDYKTNFDEACGNFAAYMNESFMVLNREYSFNSNGEATDINTYIDPTKYNHIFADQSLDNMNFWVQILIDAKVRRGISASLIPKM